MLALVDPERGVHFACYAVTTDLVTAYIDRDGTEGWAPVDLPRMRLIHRLLSLVAVDYLLRPSDFQRVLRVCRRCDAVLFDSGRHDDICRAAPRTEARSARPEVPRRIPIRSGIVARPPRITISRKEEEAS